jgi:hypothetical protein
MRRLQTEKPDVSKIYGKIQYVDHFPDYRAEVVNVFEDLEVREVDYVPMRPGEWQIVSAFPDYRIQIVETFGHFKIKYV